MNIVEADSMSKDAYSQRSRLINTLLMGKSETKLFASENGLKKR